MAVLWTTCCIGKLIKLGRYNGGILGHVLGAQIHHSSNGAGDRRFLHAIIRQCFVCPSKIMQVIKCQSPYCDCGGVVGTVPARGCLVLCKKGLGTIDMLSPSLENLGNMSFIQILNPNLQLGLLWCYSFSLGALTSSLPLK